MYHDLLSLAKNVSLQTSKRAIRNIALTEMRAAFKNVGIIEKDSVKLEDLQRKIANRVAASLGDLDSVEIAYAQNGQKLEAVKALKNRTLGGLLDCKVFVESWMNRYV